MGKITDSTGDAQALAWRPARMLLVALWLGLLAGITEAVLLGVKRFYLGQLIRVGPDVVWLAPAADALFVLAPAVVFALVAWRRPSRRLSQAALFAFGFVAVLGVVLLYSPVELYAKALLAAGAAVQIMRMVSRRAHGFERLVGRTLPAVVGVIVLLTAGVHGLRWLTFRQAVARLPPIAARPPNVLLIVLDTVRAQDLSLLGYRRQTTPNLERWARSGVVFERAYSTSPWTFPSHASIFTGRWPHEMSANWQKPLDATSPTLAEVLRDKGYLTAGFAANTFFCTTEFGIGRGFLHFEDYSVSASQAIVSTSIGRELISFSLNQDSSFHIREWLGYEQIPGRKSAAQVNAGLLQWLSRQDGQRPFFAFLNYLDAHQPFLPPSPFDTAFLGDRPRGDPRHWWDRKWTPAEIQTETDSYDGALAYIDHELGVLFEELQRRGELDRTVVVVTSDHGEHLGEHGFMRHGNTVYSEVLHVPLLIRFPAATGSGARVAEPISLRDLPATILGLVNVGCDACLPGRTLAPFWMGSAGAAAGDRPSPIFAELSQGVRIPERYPNAKADLQSLIAGDLHYIVNSLGVEELYDLSADPREASNLAGSADRAADLARLRAQLDAVAHPARPSGR